VTLDILARIAAWCRLDPNRLAHISPAGRLTYGDLGRRSDAVAAFLECTLEDDASPVVVIGHKEPEMLLGFLGAVKTGHPYVPLDASLPERRVEQVIEIAGARVVLTVEAIRSALSNPLIPQAKRLDRHDPYYVMFTSGSTGEPKGVVVTLGNLTSFVEWMLAEFDFANGREVYLNQAPFNFDLSVMDTYSSLVTGGTLVSTTASEISDPPRLFQSLGASGVTTWVSTPSFAQLCVAEPKFNATLLPGLRRFLFCGETLPWRLASELVERFPNAKVWNTYGPTEATVATTSIRIDRAILQRYPVLPVGYPKPDCRIEVLDQRGRPVTPGERGEIVIAGPHVSAGYCSRPDLTSRSFFERSGQRAYRTGDRGHLEDGLLFFDGRIDTQVKLHGYRIELGDVEANLRALPGTRDAAVIPLCRNDSIDALAAFVVCDRLPNESDFEAGVRLRRALGERVPSYMVPRVVRLADALPMTANGKVDRRRLAESLP
jgi:D-alanine--poly(phosphoribitol) ligase subunit 1